MEDPNSPVEDNEQNAAPTTIEVPIRIENQTSGTRIPGTIVTFQPSIEEAKAAVEKAGSVLIQKNKAADEAARKEAEARKNASADAAAAKAVQSLAEAAVKAKTAKEQAEKKLSAAQITAIEIEDAKAITSEADEDGDLPETLKLAPGEWTVAVLHPEYRPLKCNLTIPINASDLVAGKKVFTLVHLTNEIDESLGRKFFTFLIVALLILVFAYAYSHHEYPNSESISASLFEASTQTKIALGQAKTLADASVDKAIKSLQAIADNTQGKGDLAVKLITAKTTIKALNDLYRQAKPQQKQVAADEDTDADVNTSDPAGGGEPDMKPAASENAAKLGTTQETESQAPATDNSQSADKVKQQEEPPVTSMLEQISKDSLAKIRELDTVIADIAHQEQLMELVKSDSLIWNSGPKWFLEILFWAIAGVLVRLIFTTGSYLRANRFYRKGVYLHVMLLVVSPVLTLVSVLLISLLQIDGDVVKVDLSDPRLLAGISFLLAATPWKTWERLQELSVRFQGSKSKDNK